MKKLLHKLFPAPLSYGALFALLLLNFMFTGLLLESYDKFTTDQKDVRSFYIEGVFERYSPSHQGSHRKLVIASGGKTYFMTFWDRHTMDITREEIEQYLGEVFIIEYIKGPMKWFPAPNQPYAITLKDGRQVLKVDREKYISTIWDVRKIDYIIVLAVSTFMLVSLILTVLTVFLRLRNKEKQKRGK